MPGTRDYILDLINKIESQKIDYHLAVIEETKKDGKINKNIHTYTSLDKKSLLSLIKYIEKNIEKKLPKSKKIDKDNR